MLANLSPLHETQAIAIAESTTDMIALWLYGKSENTAKAYRRDLNDFLAFVSGRAIETWTVNDIQAFGMALKANGLKPASVNRKLLAVKSLLSYGQKLGLLRANAGAAVPVERTKDTLNERILTYSQVMEMIYTAESPLERAILRALYGTACRSEEFRQLKWTDFSQGSDGETYLSIFGKGSKTRSIRISQGLFDDFPKTSDLVLATKTGKPWDASRLVKLVKRAGERIGMPDVSPHWFRHSHATHALERGCPVHIVQATLGHSSLATTENYIHARPNDSSGLYLAI